jgi:hypothetical protein
MKKSMTQTLSAVLMVVLLTTLSLVMFFSMLQKPSVMGYQLLGAGTTYYVDSTNGNDGNDGKSPAQAIKTTTKVNTLALQPGDNVLFKRGEIWRILDTSEIVDRSGDATGYITYAAYGEGPKPLLIRSKEANSNSNWSTTAANVWQSQFTINDDVGLAIYNNENSYGAKESTLAGLNSQGEFFYDSASDRVYIYSVGNPATYYSDIELSKKGNIFDINNGQYIVIQDLDLRYSGKDAVFILNSDHVYLTNLTVRFIGGSYQSGTLRYGNCLETLGTSDHIFMEYNNISQCYDAAVSNQQDDNPAASQTFLYYRYNLIKDTRYCYEFFNKNAASVSTDIYFDHNTCICSGCGFGGSGYAKHFRTGVTRGALDRFNISNNIFYNSTSYAIDINDIFVDQLLSVDHNLYWEPNGADNLILWKSVVYSFNNFANYQNSENQDSHSQKGDPLFADAANWNYRPLPNSPACTISSTGSYVGALPCAGEQSNSPPTHTNPLLQASDPSNSTDATLQCLNRSTSDPDSDTVTNNYRWFRNNSLTAFTGSTVAPADTSVGDIWKCEIRPYDGTSYGTRLNSTSLTVRPLCDNGICEPGESCSSCIDDCGSCSSDTITACVLGDKSWDEDTVSVSAYDLASCFTDPLSQQLTYTAAGNSSIIVRIGSNGLVNLSSPSDWSGLEEVSFTARAGNRSVETESVMLTVNPVADCGDSTCESGEDCMTCPSDCGSCGFCGDSSCDANESCSACSQDCGACPVCGDGSCSVAEDCRSCAADCGACTGGGGGGGGGGTKPVEEEDITCGDWGECIDGWQRQYCSDGSSDLRACIIPLPEQPKENVSKNTSVNEAVVPVVPATQESPTKEPEQEKPVETVSNASTRLIVPGLIALVVAVVSVSFILAMKRPKSDIPSEIVVYVKEAKAAGYQRSRMRQELLDAGWDKDTVDKAINK